MGPMRHAKHSVKGKKTPLKGGNRSCHCERCGFQVCTGTHGDRRGERGWDGMGWDGWDGMDGMDGMMGWMGWDGWDGCEFSWRL